MKNCLLFPGKVASGLLTKVILVMLLAVNSTIAWGGKPFNSSPEWEGPWLYVSCKTHKATYSKNLSVSMSAMNNQVWKDCDWHHWNVDDGNGIGSTVKKKSEENSLMAIFDLYKHTESVSSYTRKTLTWNYGLHGYSKKHCNQIALYAMNSEDLAKNTKLDCTEGYSNKSGSSYVINHQGQYKEKKHSSGSCTFIFDNPSGSWKELTWYLVFTHVIGNGAGAEKNIDQWGGFENKNYSWEAKYYKIVHYDRNGGSGSMSDQTILDSGTLYNNQMQRTGCLFLGWNTNSDGSGTSYTNSQSISVTESNRGHMTLYAQWASAPINLRGEFDQLSRTNQLTWTTQSDQQTKGTYVIYRNGQQIGTVNRTQDATNFVYNDVNKDSIGDFDYESMVNYEVYYIPDGWNVSTKNTSLRASFAIDTHRSLPIKRFEANSETDRIVLTWSSNGFPKNWGNYFYIYVDNETTPADTICPDNDQTSFRWEHRTTSQHSIRVNSRDSLLTWYTEEPLNGAVPHDYRVVSLIDGTTFETATAKNRGIKSATKLLSMEATKGVYSDKVKLSWHVDQQGSTTQKTYIISRQEVADGSEAVDIHTFNSTNDYLSYIDDSPQPGVYYTYTVTVQDRMPSGVVLETHGSDIGFAQTTGTISGRITYHSTGMAVSGVNVKAQQTSNDQTSAQYRAIRFLSSNGRINWVYPTSSATAYASRIFDNPYSLQMWVHPEQSGRQYFAGLAKGAGYEVYQSSKYANTGERVDTTGYLWRMKRISVSTYKNNPSAYPGAKPITMKSYIFSTVPIWVVREISSAWTIGLDDQNHLTLYGSNITKINGEDPVPGTEYETEPTVVGEYVTLAFQKLTLQQGKYNHIVLSREGDQLYGRMVCMGEDSVPYVLSDTLTVTTTIDLSQATELSLGGFVGYVDEFRLWTKNLTDQEILDNYDHLLLGTEQSLETYWTFDEGLNEQFFDRSRTGSVFHAHHGTIGVDAVPTHHVPEQLALKAKTDANGNYIIQGVPFSGDGTTYAVIPESGEHQFNPSQHLCYVSNNSLVHSNTNFEDYSSFSVSGYVYYDSTDYPVEGCNLYVDGVMCLKEDGQPVVTDYRGHYEISVPVGEHFIRVEKEGHVFVNGGRYPKDDNTNATFTAPIRNLNFKDKTLINFTGRVVGGDIEGNKPIGFRLSDNNIGKATLTLVPQNNFYHLNVKEVTNGTTFDVVPNDETVPVTSVRSDTIRSTAWRGAGDNSNAIYIRTDSISGEFSALIPPIAYYISSIRVESSNLDIIHESIAMDMSEALTVQTDSAANEYGVMEYYAYNSLLRKTYHPEHATFTVRQNGHPDGSFGIDGYVIDDALGKLVLDSIHYVENDTVRYKYGYPLFCTNDPYVFEIEGYEQFYNMDSGDTVVSLVPMANTIVTIENALSAEQSVYLMNNDDEAEPSSIGLLRSNQLRLDSVGKALYYWYGGFPNLSEDHTRTLNIYYGENGTDWEGNPLTGVVLGNFPTGDNIITRGPDHVDMILRDPPGSQSFTTWETGTVTSYGEFSTSTFTDSDNTSGAFDWAMDITMSGADPSGISIGGTVFHGDAQRMNGTERSMQVISSNSVKHSVSVTQTISTSDSPEFDGADGDLFIGTETNLVIGNTLKVGLYRDPADATKAVIDKKDNMGVGMTFGTDFVYSQHAIEHTMIPELERLRNTFLTPASAGNTNTGSTPIYVTALSPDDPKYGTPNTYTMISPSTGSFIDTVQYYNTQINNWKNRLADNEREKLETYWSRSALVYEGKAINRSLDGGATITISTTTEIEESESYTSTGDTVKIHNRGGGFNILSLGGRWTHDWSHGEENSSTFQGEETTSTTFSYTLKDNDTDDLISVDVYSDQGLYCSPIFRTRGGQTSNPYEGVVETKYEQPGSVIMEGTTQIEMPQIEVLQPVMNNLSSGSAATYTLRLSNQSPVETDRSFRLFEEDNTNPDGAQLIIDGQPLTDGRVIRIPAGQTVTKTLQLKQSNVGVLNYENIGLVFASIGQSDPTTGIADKAYISAYFVPSSSPVTLEVNTNTINTSPDTVLTLTMKDFDSNYYNLKAFRLQYKPQGGAWTQFHEYVLHESDHTGMSYEVLPSNTAAVQYTLPMKRFTDGTYTFRIVSVSTHNSSEIYVYSNEQTVVVDMSRPRPLGQAQPSDGILDIGDELSITFNEPFLSGELTEHNFLVTGVLNGAPVEHQTALRAYNDTAQAAAVTEANINLSDKDFSLEAWLNIHSAGTLLRHGNGKKTMEIGTDETGHLVVSLFGDSIVLTSTAVLPRDKWVFLTFSREMVDSQNGKINAAAAYDESTLNLLTNVAVPFYPGNGPLAVGCGAEATIHEVLLWDEVRDITTALAQRSVTKTPATRHLIGYWKMNEGEGKTVRDYARSRNMVMPAETWYLNNVNKAATLNQGQHLTIYTGSVALMPQDDYAVEFWMQGGAQAGAAQLMQSGEVGFWLDASGRLQLQSGQTNQTVTDQTLSDGKWHHLMLNVRRTGTAAVYVDGLRVLTISATDIGEFSSDSILFGVRRTYIPETATTDAHYRYDRHFTGAVDEIRFWQTTISSDLLASKRKTRLTGQEPGLSLYYPFEKKQLDEYNQIVTVETPQEMSGHGLTATLNDQLAILIYSDDAPALQEKPTQTNVAFAFTASDTKIVIDVKESPANIDGCTLNFTVRDVRDVNGNKSQPATWSAFIHRNELAWQDEDLTVVKREDESYTVTTSLVNRSGTPQRWSLSDLPTSLTASSTSGMLNPLEREEITFVVDETAPIGKHERTIYAMGNNGVLTPVTLHLTVTGDIPEWTVNPSAYPFSMDVIGQLDVFGKISENEDDMVAAFIGDECRGVAHPKYMERYDGYFVTLTISGNDIDNNKPISFRAYDASTGITYTQVAPDSIQYHSLSIIGRYNAPELFSVKDLIEQSIQLKKGWNWISLYVTADNMSPTAILDGIKEDVELIKGQTGREGFMMYSYDMWGGSMANLMNSKMYSVKMRNDRTLRVVGQRVNANECPIELATGWNWIGYCSEKRMSIGTALADMDPQSEDLILSQRGMAYYDDYEWVGSLGELQPGYGYIVFNSGQTKQFTYPSLSVAAAPARLMASTATVEPVVGSAYPYNMVLFAQVTGDGKPLEQVQLLIFAGEECRAAGVTDENGRVNLLIPGEELTGLSFRVVVGDKTYDATETLNYETDAIVGTPEAPFLIDLKGITGLFGTQAGTQKTGTYDVLGRRLPEGHHLPQGVYIINGKKVVR